MLLPMIVIAAAAFPAGNGRELLMAPWAVECGHEEGEEQVRQATADRQTRYEAQDQKEDEDADVKHQPIPDDR